MTIVEFLDFYGTTFNSLCEIQRARFQIWERDENFQFSLWDSLEIKKKLEASKNELSILFVRFLKGEKNEWAS